MVRLAAGAVVQQARGSYDAQVCALGLGDVFGQPRHAQDVIECVGSVAGAVQMTRLFQCDVRHRRGWR